VRRALADRLLELGSLEALATELGVSLGTARRLVKQGPPLRWSSARLEAYAQELYRRAHRFESERDPIVRAELERRRRAPVFATAARVAAVRSLTRALRQLERRRPCEKGNWSPRAELARELGITSVRLGRWIAAGHVPADFMPRVSEWAADQAERELRRIAERGQVEALIEQAKVPAFAHTLPGAPRKFAARAPDLRTHEGRTESEEQSGYQWVLRVEGWSTFELVERLYEWARTRRRPPGMSQSGRWWIVTALCTIYHPHGRGSGPGRPKSPGAIRQFESATDRQRGRDLSLGVPVSSRTVKHGGIERAAKLFRESMTIEHCEQEQVFVHGLIVRNWRDRSETERRNYRQRVAARLANEAALRELGREKRRATKRAAARKKALGRRGSAAGDGSRTRATSAGARPGKKKRP
jgi:hypothetical protein